LIVVVDYVCWIVVVAVWLHCYVVRCVTFVVVRFDLRSLLFVDLLHLLLPVFVDLLLLRCYRSLLIYCSFVFSFVVVTLLLFLLRCCFCYVVVYVTLLIHVVVVVVT
jgi:hypothetical protein